jgi:hypothetical protein
VVGDSVWDLLAARRARALRVGLASGGYGQDELEKAGAYRTYEDPLDLMNHLDEVGVRTREDLICFCEGPTEEPGFRRCSFFDGCRPVSRSKTLTHRQISVFESSPLYGFGLANPFG